MYMKKIASILLGSAFALTLGVGVAGAQTAGIVTTTTTNPLYDVACVQTAIDKRETALMGVADTLNASVKDAISTRGTELKASWAMTTDGPARRTSRRVAWDKYKTSRNTAISTAKSSRSVIGETYKTEMGVCGAALKAVAISEVGTIKLEN